MDQNQVGPSLLKHAGQPFQGLNRDVHQRLSRRHDVQVVIGLD